MLRLGPGQMYRRETTVHHSVNGRLLSVGRLVQRGSGGIAAAAASSNEETSRETRRTNCVKPAASYNA